MKHLMDLRKKVSALFGTITSVISVQLRSNIWFKTIMPGTKYVQVNLTEIDLTIENLTLKIELNIEKRKRQEVERELDDMKKMWKSVNKHLGAIISGI